MAKAPEPAVSPAAGDTEEAPAAASSQVKLGDPSLTAGITGDGDLTTEQIRAWLDDEANHVALEVELPLGLDAGASMIKGIQDNPLTRAKIELGRQLFFDGRLSSDGTISCASCHQPVHGYAAETQFGVGVDDQEGNVNTPVAYNRILSDKQFWDGRAATLEEQAKGPIANPIEMAFTHEACVEQLKNIKGYRIQFEKLFPDDGVNIDNVAKAIASFERVIVTGPSPHDYNERLRAYADYTEEDLAEIKEDEPEEFARYEQIKADAAAHAMSESARRGRELFFTEKANCSACHVGANLADEKYHNLGIGMDAEEPNLGRFGQTGEEKDKGAFKTPTIRNVADSPPYMHDGSLKTLEEVVEHYVKGGTPNEWLSKDIVKLKLSDQDKKDLVAFMQACSGPLPPVQEGRLPQ
ncbi:MAG: c-type cytochrome [Planctomycetota bacterium]|nr:c-type cytochrome [Planctomycetota bacterium]